VTPFTVGAWNIVNRTILPLIYLPDVTAGLPELPEGVSGGETFGLGDINHSIYFSPADSGPVIWGGGPSLTIPTGAPAASTTGTALIVWSSSSRAISVAGVSGRTKTTSVFISSLASIGRHSPSLAGSQVPKRAPFPRRFRALPSAAKDFCYRLFQGPGV